MSPFRMRKTWRLGPIFVTVTQAGRLTWGFDVGPYRYNATNRRSTFDTPGPGYVTHRHRRHER